MSAPNRQNTKPESWQKRTEKARLAAKKRIAVINWLFLLTLVIGLALPDQPMIPVRGAGAQDWDHRAFWKETPNGVLRTGIAIKGMSEASVLAATYGWVVGVGDESVTVLGPTWRLHKYSNLRSVQTAWGRWVAAGDILGRLDSTDSTLYYSVVSLLPYVWQFSSDRDAFRKLFYLDPSPYLNPQGFGSQPRKPDYETYVN